MKAGKCSKIYKIQEEYLEIEMDRAIELGEDPTKRYWKKHRLIK